MIYYDLVTYAMNFPNCSAFSTIAIRISQRTKIYPNRYLYLRGPIDIDQS